MDGMDNGICPVLQWERSLFLDGARPTTLPGMKIRPDWRDRLRALVQGKEWAPICRAAKLNPTFLRDVLDRGTNPQMANLEKLAGALAAPLTDWYFEADQAGETTDEERRAGVPRLLPRLDLMPRNLPVYGSASCGEDGEFEFNTGEVIDFVKRPPRLEGIKDAYALYLVGNSMVPWRKAGQLVYVHPGQPPQIEDHVVVQFKAQKAGEAPRAMVKQLARLTSADMVLHQYNPARDRTFKRKDVVAVHRIVDWDELLGI